MNKYNRLISGTISATGAKGCLTVDIYDVLSAFDVSCPAIQHAVKKLLCAGQRGHKDVVQDLEEAKHAIERAIELATGVTQ
jgi:hypothetical protein